MSGSHDYDQEREQAHGHGHKQSFEERALKQFDRMADALEKAHGIERLVALMQQGFRELRLAIQEDLRNAEERIMAQTTEQLTGVKASLVQVATKIDNIKADVGTLNAKITELQNMPPGWTAADQALLDEIEGLGTNILAGATAADDLTAGPVFEPVEPPPAVPETPMELSARLQRNESRNKVPAGLSKGQSYAGETEAQRQQRERNEGRSGQAYPGETAPQRQERERAEREQNERLNR